MGKRTLFLLLPIVVVMLIILVLLFQNPNPTVETAISYTRYLTMQSRVRSAVIRGDQVSARDDAGRSFSTNVSSGSAEATHLAEQGVEVTLAPATTDSTVGGYIVLAVNGFWLLASLWYFHRIARSVEKLGRGKQEDAKPAGAI